MKDHYLYACSRARLSDEYVMSYMSEQCCIRVSHVLCEGVMSRVGESCDVWVSHVTNRWVLICAHVHRRGRWFVCKADTLMYIYSIRIYLHIFVLIYAHIFMYIVYICKYVFLHIYLYNIHLCVMYVNLYIHVYTCMEYTHIQTHSLTYKHTLSHTYTHTSVCIYQEQMHWWENRERETHTENEWLRFKGEGAAVYSRMTQRVHI